VTRPASAGPDRPLPDPTGLGRTRRGDPLTLINPLSDTLRGRWTEDDQQLQIHAVSHTTDHFSFLRKFLPLIRNPSSVRIEEDMLVARFIGRIPVIVGSILFAIGGIVLIVLGATASPGDTGKIVIGVALVVGAGLLILDAVTEPSSASST
jgi:hypothetical protein